MTLSLTFACLWILFSAITAFLPMRYQYAPGLTLLIAAIPLLVFIAMQHGTLPVALFLFAVGSMFRRPFMGLARYLGTRLARKA